MNCNKCNDSFSYDRLEGMPLGSAYVPWQTFCNVMDAGKGLNYGTIFTELVLPFYGAAAACDHKRRGNCEYCKK